MPETPRITRSATVRLETLRSAGHTVHWGRATDGRTAFYWARVTPLRSASARNVRAGDADSLMSKVQQIVAAGESSHVVSAFSDPLRYCDGCGTELSFDPGGDPVFACPSAGPGHTSVTPL